MFLKIQFWTGVHNSPSPHIRLAQCKHKVPLRRDFVYNMSETIKGLEAFYRELAAKNPDLDLVADQLNHAHKLSLRFKGPKKMKIRSEKNLEADAEPQEEYKTAKQLAAARGYDERTIRYIARSKGWPKFGRAYKGTLAMLDEYISEKAGGQFRLTQNQTKPPGQR